MCLQHAWTIWDNCSGVFRHDCGLLKSFCMVCKGYTKNPERLYNCDPYDVDPKELMTYCNSSSNMKGFSKYDVRGNTVYTNMNLMEPTDSLLPESCQ